MVKNTAKAFTTIKVVESIKESGLTIKSMAMESLITPMEIDMRAHGKTDKDQITAFMSTQMVMCMMDSGETISNRDTVNFKWLQVTSMKAIGKAAKKMDQVHSYLFRTLYLCKWRHL